MLFFCKPSVEHFEINLSLILLYLVMIKAYSSLTIKNDTEFLLSSFAFLFTQNLIVSWDALVSFIKKKNVSVFGSSPN